jgi:hypothetical protein
MKFVKTAEYLSRKVKTIEEAIERIKADMANSHVDRDTPHWAAYLAHLETKLNAAKSDIAS